MKLSDVSTQYVKLLQMGGSGSGKTVASSTFPKPIKYFNFDPEGIQSLLTMYRNDEKTLNQIEFENYIDENNKKPVAWKNFERDKNKLIDIASKGEKFPYATVVFDSLTTMEDAMMNELKVLVKTNRVQNQATQQDYGIMIGTLELLIPELLSLPCHVIMNAHIQTIQDGITQEILRLPLVTGKKLPQKLPLWFGETYRAVSKREGNVQSYTWQIRASDKFDLKSRIIPGEIQGPIPAHFSEIEKYITVKQDAQ